MAGIVYAVRHAAPPLEKQKRYWGKADPGVDAESLAQAERIAYEMTPSPARIFTSPLTRARRTAETIAEKLGMAPEIMPELAEVDFGRFDGLTFSEVENRYPEAANEWAKQGDAFTFPGGESIPDFLDRVKRAFSVCINIPETAILCVTHGGVLSAWRCFFHDFPPATRFSLTPEYATLMTFTGNSF